MIGRWIAAATFAALCSLARAETAISAAEADAMAPPDVARKVLEQFYENLDTSHSLMKHSEYDPLRYIQFDTRPSGTSEQDLCTFDRIWFDMAPAGPETPDAHAPMWLSTLDVRHMFFFLADPAEGRKGVEGSERMALNGRCKGAAQKWGPTVQAKDLSDALVGLRVFRTIPKQLADKPRSIKIDCNWDLKTCTDDLAQLQPQHLMGVTDCGNEVQSYCFAFWTGGHAGPNVRVWYHVEPGKAVIERIFVEYMIME